MKKYKGYSLFNDVEDNTLRTWNRCAVLFNINKDHSPEMVEKYAMQFTDLDRAQMFAMYKYIEAKGYDMVKAELNRNGTLEV